MTKNDDFIEYGLVDEKLETDKDELCGTVIKISRYLDSLRPSIEKFNNQCGGDIDFDIKVCTKMLLLLYGELEHDFNFAIDTRGMNEKEKKDAKQRNGWRTVPF